MKQFIPSEVKNILKKYCWKIIFGKRIFANGTLLNEKCLQELALNPESIPNLNVFTIGNEDGILQYLLNKTGTTSKLFIDIGSNDCINSNCANLAFHHKWSGYFIDANEQLIKRGQYIYESVFGKENNRFKFIKTIVTPQNINSLLQTTSSFPEIDFLSMDLDGNDYHIWKSINSISPRIVVVEVQIEKGINDFIPAYNEVFEKYEANIPKGASPVSMIELAHLKGYELVAANTNGYNLFFVRKDCLKSLKPLSISSLIKNPIL
jgi:hypothetical protein